MDARSEHEVIDIGGTFAEGERGPAISESWVGRVRHEESWPPRWDEAEVAPPRSATIGGRWAPKKETDGDAAAPPVLPEQGIG
jgi:hypothetical protein